MKSALVFAAVLALAACVVFPGDKEKDNKLADNAFLQKQMNILTLFARLQQRSILKEETEIGDSYDIEANIGHYKDPHAVKKYIVYYKKGLLGKDEHFNAHNEKHLEEAILLFELLYYANDYDTFHKTACWARDRVNPELFAYALSVAIFQREDTKDFVLPPAYEVHPYFYVDRDVIQKGQEYWMQEYGTRKVKEHHIPVNFTTRNQEDLLAYFREDVNLNTFNLYYYLNYPTWFNSTAYGKKFERHGEQFYYTQRQIYARYFLERLSNDLPDISPFFYNKHFKTAYNPHLRYPNGDEMPTRPSNLYPDPFYAHQMKKFEERLEDAIDLGYVFNKDFVPYNLYQDEHGMEYIGKIIKGSFDSEYPNFYGSLLSFYCYTIGRITDPHNKIGVPPSALEHYATALRDPAYYQLFKRLDHFVQKYKNRLPRYTHDELSYPGVKVENVEVAKLYTFFEPSEITLAVTVYADNYEDALSINTNARQYRLNHLPFTYTIDVNSDKKQDVHVRVFLGPKYDQLGRERDINDARHYFVELDRFPYQVEAGTTKIERHSHDSSIISSQHESYRNMFFHVKEALEGKRKYYLNKNHNYCGYPENLLIPKGKKGGQAFTFYVMVTPYVKQDEHDFEPYDHKAFSYCGVGNGRKYPDDKPLGFPFDRKIHNQDFHTPNMYFKDVLIFHKEHDGIINVTH